MIIHYKSIFRDFMNLLLVILSAISCSQQEPNEKGESDSLIYSTIAGCDGQFYLERNSSPFVLPFEVGKTYKTGLTNCSSSYHSSGRPDQYAFDFNIPEGDPFVAARGGTVYEIGEESTETHLVGNFVTIDHGDGTYGIYAHSPIGGILVKVNDVVEQGQEIGLVGRTGLAGYPHLHFIVVNSIPDWPYEGTPISFRNAEPKDLILKGSTMYKAAAY